jgi:uncharacterized protein YjiS (DUF1127 family)
MTPRSLLKGLRAAVRRFRRNARLRQDEQDLRLLPDHLLCDIGIGRSEISATMRSGRGSDGHEATCRE